MHQPCFLPWAGYWNRLLSADVFVLAAGMPFSTSAVAFQHRVRLGPNWLTLAVKGGAGQWLKDTRYSRRCLRKIRRSLAYEFGQTRHAYGFRVEPVLQALAAHEGEGDGLLVDLNYDLLVAVGVAMGVRIEDKVFVDLDPRPGRGATEKIRDILEVYAPGRNELLLGRGGLTYVELDKLAAGTRVWFQNLRTDTPPDTALSTIAREPDPAGWFRAAALWQRPSDAISAINCNGTGRA